MSVMAYKQGRVPPLGSQQCPGLQSEMDFQPEELQLRKDGVGPEKEAYRAAEKLKDKKCLITVGIVE
jgi:hypothetical protein